MKLNKVILHLLYTVTLIATVALTWYGYGYYTINLVDRPHHGLHDTLKPGGLLGHGLGFVGALLMFMLLLYIARKYLRFMQGWGNIRHWLNFHIWLGITSPILVTFHTTFKFGGIVSVSFWSMVAVAASGFFGRFVYLQIPRRLSGEELTSEELREVEDQLSRAIVRSISENDFLSRRVLSIAGFTPKTEDVRSPKIGFWFLDDLKLRFDLLRLRRELYSGTDLNRDTITRLIRSIRDRHLLKRRVAFLKAAHRILHHWHLIHRPFAMVMFLIFLVHVTVVAILGYTWVF